MISTSQVGSLIASEGEQLKNKSVVSRKSDLIALQNVRESQKQP